MAAANFKYLVFDIESVADGELVSRLRFPGQKLTPGQAIARYRAELMEKHDSDFIPYTFQVPITLVVAKVDRDFRLLEITSLDEPQFRSHVIAEYFWRGWEKYRRPTLVSFNGRTFDVPLLELAAFRFGLSLPGWFNLEAKSYEQYRGRYNILAHIDLQELLTNFGSTRFTGGLNLASNLLGKPGKMEIQGHMVQDLYDAGEHQAISDYCKCDVLDTYFVFLRSRVMVGQLTLEAEQDLIAQTKAWLEEQRREVRAFQLYLDNWCDWANPWEKEEKKA